MTSGRRVPFVPRADARRGSHSRVVVGDSVILYGDELRTFVYTLQATAIQPQPPPPQQQQIRQCVGISVQTNASAHADRVRGGKKFAKLQDPRREEKIALGT